MYVPPTSAQGTKAISVPNRQRRKIWLLQALEILELQARERKAVELG